MSTSAPRSDPSRLAPDTYFPSALTVGPGGNIIEIASSDFIQGGVQGFRLYDSEAAQANPNWLRTAGGLDTNSVLTARLSIIGYPSELTIAQHLPNAGELVPMFYSPTGDTWLLRARDIVGLFPGTWLVTWEVHGAPPLRASTAGGLATATAAYLAAPQAPLITPALDMSADVEWSARADNAGAANRDFAFTIGPTGAPASADELLGTLAAGGRIRQGRTIRASLTGGATIGVYYRAPSAATITYTLRDLSITPRTITVTTTP